MKNLIASLALIAACYSVTAQTKKPDSTRKPVPASTNRSHLVQEKIWPTSNTKDGKVIPSHPIALTRNKL